MTVPALARLDRLAHLVILLSRLRREQLAPAVHRVGVGHREADELVHHLLGVDVTVILAQACILCLENR